MSQHLRVGSIDLVERALAPGLGFLLQLLSCQPVAGSRRHFYAQHMLFDARDTFNEAK